MTRWSGTEPTGFDRREAFLEAGDILIVQGKQIAAHVLEASAVDIEFTQGRFVIAGTDRGIGVLELADKLRGGLKLPAGGGPNKGPSAPSALPALFPPLQGVAPFKDNFWSTSSQPGGSCGAERYRTRARSALGRRRFGRRGFWLLINSLLALRRGLHRHLGHLHRNNRRHLDQWNRRG